MTGRIENKVAIVMGAGQTPGDTIGNGRATALLFAREGARVLAVDRNLLSAEETTSTPRLRTSSMVPASTIEVLGISPMGEYSIATLALGASRFRSERTIDSRSW